MAAGRSAGGVRAFPPRGERLWEAQLQGSPVSDWPQGVGLERECVHLTAGLKVKLGAPTGPPREWSGCQSE